MTCYKSLPCTTVQFLYKYLRVSLSLLPSPCPGQILGCEQAEAGARTLFTATQSIWELPHLLVSGQTPLLHTCPTLLQLISLLQGTSTPTTLIQENCTPGNKQYTRLNEGSGEGRKYKWMTAGLVSTVRDCSVWPSICIHLSGMPAPRFGLERLMDFLVQFEQMLYCQTKQVQFMSELFQFLLYY